MGTTESKCKTKFPEICDKKCPEIVNTPCPEKALNTKDGYFTSGQINLSDQNRIPVKNIDQCRQIAKWNGGLGYLYRNENHPYYPHTCAIRTAMGSGNVAQEDSHKMGCVDTSKNVDNNCE
jgi:hypothetical protein